MSRKILFAMAAVALAGCESDPAFAPEANTALQPSSSVGTQSLNTYSGQGTAAHIKVLFLDKKIGDTGPLPPSGGIRDVTFLKLAPAPGVTLRLGHAITIGRGNLSVTETAVAGVRLNLAGQDVRISVLLTRASAQCVNNRPVLSGTTDIVQITVNGVTKTITPAPNTSLPLLGGVIVLNEQVKTANSITVTGAHIKIPGVADIALSRSHADINCNGTPNCSIIGDHFEGAGKINGANGQEFAVFAGKFNTGLRGHLVFFDIATGISVRSTAITGYTVVTGQPNARQFRGSANVQAANGTVTSQTFLVRYTESNPDSFSLTLSGGLFWSGTMTQGDIKLAAADFDPDCRF